MLIEMNEQLEREILEKDKVTFYKREFQRDAKNVTTVCNFSS